MNRLKIVGLKVLYGKFSTCSFTNLIYLPYELQYNKKLSFNVYVASKWEIQVKQVLPIQRLTDWWKGSEHIQIFRERKQNFRYVSSKIVNITTRSLEEVFQCAC